MATPTKSWWTDITDLWKATIAIFMNVYNPDIPALKAAIGKWWTQLILNALDVATPIVNAGVGALSGIVSTFADTMNTNGAPLAATVKAPIAALAAGAFATSAANLTGAGPSTPDNAVAQASSAFAEAFGFGISSAAVTAAFESLFPEKLNTLNGVGPMLAQMAGFSEVAANVLGPLYRNAFGRSLDYQYRKTFTPELPTREEAQRMLSRGIITQAQCTALEQLNGLAAAWASATETAAYRPVPPFLLARAAEAGAIPTAALTAALTFAGFRPADITMLETAYAALALLPYQTQYLSAAVRSTELGTMTPDELTGVMNDINLSQDAQAIVQLTVATRKLEQLAELYRKSISEGYKYGTITDSQYIPALEAIGIGAADAQAHFAVDSIAKTGKALATAIKAEARLAAQQQRGAVNAAVASYKAGTIDGIALEAALLAAGVDPTVAGFILVVQEQRLSGNQVFVYGVELPRTQALVLREKVAALGKQTTAQLVTPAAALAQLGQLGIPDANAKALLADWAATITPAADVGTLQPI